MSNDYSPTSQCVAKTVCTRELHKPQAYFDFSQFCCHSRLSHRVVCIRTLQLLLCGEFQRDSVVEHRINQLEKSAWLPEVRAFLNVCRSVQGTLLDGIEEECGREVLLAIGELVICRVFQEGHHPKRHFKSSMQWVLRFCHCSLACISVHGRIRALSLRAKSNARAFTRCFDSKLGIRLTKTIGASLQIDKAGRLRVSQVGISQAQRHAYVLPRLIRKL
mmetsp:Transcript_27326/g.88279  ORF Transcript_27326/g.88279 Transcript_27326/m.88279 type:complete len:219 (+) Transcript_27326:416-1072(+)